ncbi:MAG: aminopeptidase [Myxococcota bacterium]
MEPGGANAGGFETPPPDNADRRRRQSITISFQAREYLASRQVDAPLAGGARNVLEGALGLTHVDGLVMVAHSTLETVAAAVYQTAEALGIEVAAYLVGEDDLRNDAFVNRLLEKLDEATVSILLAPEGALPDAFLDRVRPGEGANRRHAVMTGVTEGVMRQSLRTDFGELDERAARLTQRLASAQRLEARAATGTELQVAFGPALRWAGGSGRLLRGGGTTHLPAGVVYTSPARVEGTLVADGGVWLPRRQAALRRRRLVFRIEDGHVVAVEGAGREEVEETLAAAPNARRVGRVGLGVNAGILAPIGIRAQDLAIPGLHLVLGDPWPEQTGAAWTCALAVPLLVRRPDVTLDGVPILVRGRYARELA